MSLAQVDERKSVFEQSSEESQLYRKLIDRSRLEGSPEKDANQGVLNWLNDKSFLAQGASKITATCVTNRLANYVGLQYYASASEIALDNAGIAKYQQNLLSKNPCFAAKADQFWRTVEAEAFKAFPGISLEGRYQIESLDLNQDPKKTGWLWERALAASGGDKAVAVEMLSICSGTVSKMEIQYPKNFSDQAYIDDAENIERLKAVVNEKLKTLPSTGDDRLVARANLNRLQTESEKLRKERAAGKPYKGLLHCDTAPGLYAQKSLPAALNIPDELKLRISKARGVPLNQIYGKTYHAITSAKVGCLVASCGATPETAASINGVLGRGYRFMVLQNEVSRQTNVRNILSEFASVNPDDTKAVNRLITDSSPLETACRSRALAQTPTLKMTCKKVFEPILSIPDPSVREAKIARAFSDMDAMTLFIAGEGANSAPQKSPRQPSCHAGWDQTRCDSAKAQLEKLKVEFEWTSAQHEQGARFGAQNCKASSDPEKLDSPKLCSSLHDNALAPNALKIESVVK